MLILYYVGVEEYMIYMQAVSLQNVYTYYLYFVFLYGCSINDILGLRLNLYDIRIVTSPYGMDIVFRCIFLVKQRIKICDVLFTNTVMYSR